MIAERSMRISRSMSKRSGHAQIQSNSLLLDPSSIPCIHQSQFRKWKTRSSQNNNNISMHFSWGAVAAINNQVRTGSVGGRIRGQVQVSTLQLVSLTLATHGDLVPPDVLGLLWHKVGNFRSNVTGGDCVGAGESDPFNGERLACIIVSGEVSEVSFSRKTYRGEQHHSWQRCRQPASGGN